MKRRTFLAAAACGPALLAYSSVLAQTPEATPRLFEYEFEGRIVAAARHWEAETVFRQGALLYSTTVDIFEDESHSAKAFDGYHSFMEDYLTFLGESSGQAAVVKERKDLSAPELGNERIAESLRVEIDGRQATIATLFVREDTVMHKWFGAGVTAFDSELFALAEANMTFAIIDIKSDEQVLGLLPALEDMPPKFFLDEEELYRFDSDGKVIVSATPTDE